MLRRVHSAALIVNPFLEPGDRAQLEAVERPSLHTPRSRHSDRRRGHATDLAREAANNHDAVLVFSGDGVFNEVVNGIEGRPPRVHPRRPDERAARALGLPRDPSPRRAGSARRSRPGTTRTISLGRVNGRRFTFAAGVGADAEFIRRMESRGRTHDGKLPGDITAAWLLTAAVRADTVHAFAADRGDRARRFGDDPQRRRVDLRRSVPRSLRARGEVRARPGRRRPVELRAARCLRSPGAACAGRRAGRACTATTSTGSRSTATCRCRSRSTGKTSATSERRTSRRNGTRLGSLV